MLQNTQVVMNGQPINLDLHASTEQLKVIMETLLVLRPSDKITCTINVYQTFLNDRTAAFQTSIPLSDNASSIAKDKKEKKSKKIVPAPVSDPMQELAAMFPELQLKHIDVPNTEEQASIGACGSVYDILTPATSSSLANSKDLDQAPALAGKAPKHSDQRGRARIKDLSDSKLGNCLNVELKDGQVLHADCRTELGYYKHSRVDLGKFIMNHDGRLVWDDEGNFHLSSEDIYLTDTLWLVAYARDCNGDCEMASIDLNTAVVNRNGNLVVDYDPEH